MSRPKGSKLLEEHKKRIGFGCLILICIVLGSFVSATD